MSHLSASEGPDKPGPDEGLSNVNETTEREVNKERHLRNNPAGL